MNRFKALIIFIMLVAITLVFSEPIFKGITPFVENKDFIISNTNLIASIGNDGLLENLALKDNMYDGVYNMYFALDRKKISITNIEKIKNDEIVTYGTNGEKDVTIKYTLMQDRLHVSVISKDAKELRLFFKESDSKPIFIKEKNYNFIQCKHVAYTIVFQNSLSMYRIGALMFISRTPVLKENSSLFEFDIIVDKDIHKLKEKLNLIDNESKLLVIDDDGKPINNIKVIMLSNDIPVDVSTSNKNGEVYFFGKTEKSTFQLLNEDLENFTSFNKDKIIIKMPKKFEFLWEPYLTGISTNSIYVGLKINKPASITIDISGKKIVDNLPDTFHMIKLDNLETSTNYNIKVLVGKTLQENLSFKTGGDEKYKFLVYGDTRTNIDWHKMICNKMANENALLVLHTGDLVESGPQLFEWNLYFNSGHSLFSKTPIMPVIGNHEHNAVYYYQAFMPPKKGGGDFQKQWYSFDLGPIHYVILDSDVQEGTVLDEFQIEWLENDLKNTNKPYIIVLFHHPFFSNVKGRGQQFREKWHNIFVKYKVSAVFNGHIHHYERFYKDGVMYVTTGGGGAPFGYGLYSEDVEYLPFSKAAAAGYLHYVIGTIEDKNIHFVVKAVGKEENHKLVGIEKILDEFEITPRNIH